MTTTIRTLAGLRQALAPRNIVIRNQDGEIRVNFKGGEEATACYTNDIMDAYNTGIAMADRRDNPPVAPTTLRSVRKAIDAKFGKGTIEMYRSPSGYYYFVSQSWEIPSLYQFNLGDTTAQDIIDHIHGYGFQTR